MKRSLKYVFFLICIIFVLILGTVIIKSIKIQKINCISQYGSCNTALVSKISELQNTPSDIFKTRTNLVSLLEQEKRVLEYSINLKFPLVYEVNVIERSAAIAFILTDGNFSLVDSDGIIVSSVSETNLPKVTSSRGLNQGELAYIAKMISHLYTLYGVGEGKVIEDGVEIPNLKGKKVIFPLEGEIDELQGALSLILSRLPSVKEASTISVIDLRFKNPVLR